MKNNLKQWLDWQNSLHTSKIELSLERVHSVAERLSLLEAAFPIITVAGTNGKGSSVTQLDAMLTANGMRVGRYTSPHLITYNERICIAGIYATDEQICQAFVAIEEVRKEISLTFFEFATLAAMFLFKQHKIDIAILEVGLGGRLDAVNIFDADIALITAIDIDHSDWLGNDRETIGFEKAGILRMDKPAVCSDPNPPQTVLKHAKQLNSKLYCLQRDFNYHETNNGWIWQTNNKTIKLPHLNLYGNFQLQNAAGVLMVLELLQLPIVPSGLVNAHVAGRFQILPGPITRIFDVAHNPLGAKVLATTLQQYAGKKQIHAVLGMLNKKDVVGFVELMQDIITSWHVAPLDTPNTTSTQFLIENLTSIGIKNITGYLSVTNAYENLIQNTKEGDIILVTGSFHTVAEVLVARCD
ncbi:bifunctional tetrahydrofolate synthase/dihydrofolate synthase [Candidatus Halobeggiatoa sp. HSG11]|nr:bifunctional tetrahydrofolate synthase/dihydrofolate synthase [Candidatus Halobeggiatoa sp. HSG11]